MGVSRNAAPVATSSPPIPRKHKPRPRSFEPNPSSPILRPRLAEEEAAPPSPRSVSPLYPSVPPSPPQEQQLLPPPLSSPLGRWSFQGSLLLVPSRRRRIEQTFKKGTIVDALMESKGGKKSSSSSNFMYEAPLGYKIEDVRPAGGIKKFQSAAYSNCVRQPS
nr:unnamed protein product [Digitaria exilis]